MHYGIFSKRQLVDQWGFTADEAILILQYQKTLPIIVENDGVDGLCINARDLWKQLKEPQGKFSNWVNRRFKTYGFEEDVDFKASQNCDAENKGISGMNQAKDYIITVDMAKHLAMLDKSEIGYLTRKYFLLMEKAVRSNSKWSFVREPMKKGYVIMDQALDEYYLRNDMRNADKYDYQYEANMINIIATGFRASELRNYVKCMDKVTRDSLTVTYNEYLMKLQEWNIAYIRMNMNRVQRFELLKRMFEATFPNAIPIKADVEISRINKNKKIFIIKLKEK